MLLTYSYLRTTSLVKTDIESLTVNALTDNELCIFVYFSAFIILCKDITVLFC